MCSRRVMMKRVFHMSCPNHRATALNRSQPGSCALRESEERCAIAHDRVARCALLFGLKILRGQPHAGSSPALGTKDRHDSVAISGTENEMPAASRNYALAARLRTGCSAGSMQKPSLGISSALLNRAREFSSATIASARRSAPNRNGALAQHRVQKS